VATPIVEDVSLHHRPDMASDHNPALAGRERRKGSKINLGRPRKNETGVAHDLLPRPFDGFPGSTEIPAATATYSIRRGSATGAAREVPPPYTLETVPQLQRAGGSRLPAATVEV